VSSDVEFCPLDPYFDREYKPTANLVGLPYTYLVVGEKRYYGGPAVYDDQTKETLEIRPVVDASLKQPGLGDRLPQQAQKLLKPGDQMTTFVCAKPDDPENHPFREVLKNHTGKLVYRVRLRSGLTVLRDKEVPTNVVVGVEFSPADIVTIEAP
jgi:hypothetical protein